MRVNVNTTPDGWKYKAYLDGVLVAWCVEADDEAGYVLVITDPHADPPTVKRVEGNVTIEPPEQSP